MWVVFIISAFCFAVISMIVVLIACLLIRYIQKKFRDDDLAEQIKKEAAERIKKEIRKEEKKE